MLRLRGGLKLRFERPDGVFIFESEVVVSERIGYIKHLVQLETEIPIEQQILTVNGIQLHGLYQTLSEYFMNEEVGGYTIIVQTVQREPQPIDLSNQPGLQPNDPLNQPGPSGVGNRFRRTCYFEYGPGLTLPSRTFQKAAF